MLYPVLIYKEDDAEGESWHAVCPDFINIDFPNPCLRPTAFAGLDDVCFNRLRKSIHEMAFTLACAGKPLPKPSSTKDIAAAIPDLIRKHASNHGEWVVSSEIVMMPVDLPDKIISLSGVLLDAHMVGRLVHRAIEYDQALENAGENSVHAWRGSGWTGVSIDDVLCGDAGALRADLRLLVSQYLEQLLELDNEDIFNLIMKTDEIVICSNPLPKL